MVQHDSIRYFLDMYKIRILSGLDTLRWGAKQFAIVHYMNNCNCPLCHWLTVAIQFLYGNNNSSMWCSKWNLVGHKSYCHFWRTKLLLANILEMWYLGCNVIAHKTIDIFSFDKDISILLNSSSSLLKISRATAYFYYLR